jgi:hypothetical protein
MHTGTRRMQDSMERPATITSTLPGALGGYSSYNNGNGFWRFSYNGYGGMGQNRMYNPYW